MGWVWAQNEKGFLTKCHMPPHLRGQGRCSHVAFQAEGESERDFVGRIMRREAAERRLHAGRVIGRSGAVRISCRGVQDKWLMDALWYKGDSCIHEGLHEALISSLLDGSNLEYVRYQTCAIFVNGKDTRNNGCVSETFLPAGCSEITLLQVLGRAGSRRFLSCETMEEQLDVLVEDIQSRTGLDARAYLLKIICLDWITLNHDRHLENIVFLQEENGRFRFGPCFDQGCALDNRLTEDGEAITPPAMFLTADETGNLRCRPLTEYAALIRRYGPALELAPGTEERIAAWNDPLYTPFEVRKTKARLVSRLQETEGFAWKCRET